MTSHDNTAEPTIVKQSHPWAVVEGGRVLFHKLNTYPPIFEVNSELESLWRKGQRTMTTQLLQGDCREMLKTLADQSVQTCITSPPYWGLRKYSDDPREIGGEPTPAEYVQGLVAVFSEVWRVLRDDGTLWLNLGDAYANDTKWGRVTSGKHAGGLQGTTYIGRNRTQTGLPSKSLIGLPWRVAFALQDAGWVLRSDIIWHKPSVMPENVNDRLTRDHEYMFLFAKRSHYFFDAAAIREEAIWQRKNNPEWQKQRAATNKKKHPNNTNAQAGGFAEWTPDQGRNKRTVWTIATRPCIGAHFATFPEELVEPCILAGSKAGDTVLDPFGGSGTVARVAERLQRKAVLIELNPAYIELQEKRTDGVQVELFV